MLSLFIAFGFSACTLNDQNIEDSCGIYKDISFTRFPLLCNYSVKNMPNNATAIIITSQEKLNENFTLHENTCSVESDPNIDFNENYLVGIFAGVKPSSGYSIKITSIVENNCQIVINYYEESSLLYGDSSNSSLYPTDFVLIPKTTKPVYLNKTTETSDAIIIGSYCGKCTGNNCTNFYQLNDYNTLKFQNVVIGNYDFNQYKHIATAKRNEYNLFLKNVPAEILNLNGQTKTYGSPDTSDQGGIYFELRQGIAEGTTVTKVFIDTNDTPDQSAEIKAFKKVILEKTIELTK